MANTTGGIRVTLSRDLSSKYFRYISPTEKSGKHFDPSPKLKWENTWNVIGVFDFMSVSEVQSLDEIGLETTNLNIDGKSVRLTDIASWKRNKDIFLFPFESHEEDTNHRKLVRELQIPHNYSMCVFWQISLSPASYDNVNSYGDVIDKVKLASDLINEIANEADQDRANNTALPPRLHLRSLGDPDLVVFHLINSAAELDAVHKLMMRTKGAPLSRLRKCNNENDSDECCPGHAFAQVEPIFCYLPEHWKKFNDPKFKQQEEISNFKIESRLYVDCGHEMAVLDSVKEVCKKAGIDADQVLINEDSIKRHEEGTDTYSSISMQLSRSDVTRWSVYTVLLNFRHLVDFSAFCSHTITNAPWRKSHLIDSYTTISMPGTPSGLEGHDAAWQLTKETHDLINDMGACIRKFSIDYLGNNQAAEFVEIYNIYKSCFFRQEFLGAARDLIPFFTQLHFCLESPVWHDFLNPTTTDELEREQGWVYYFNDDLAFLMDSCNRAIRNRIEQRSLTKDIGNSQSIRYGAGKLISACTAVFWLCSEVFNTTNSNHHAKYNFAACVFSGNAGRITCRELFQEFRDYSESKTGIKLEQSPLDWNARLFVLDVSGRSMLRPEICFVHCLHETAELSNWLDNDNSSNIRKTVNYWILSQATIEYYRALTDNGLAKDIDNVHIFAQELMTTCFVLSLGCDSANDVQQTLIEAYDSLHPDQFAESLIQSISDYGFSPKAKDLTIERVAGKCDIPTNLVEWQTTLGGIELFSQIEELKMFSTEVTADIGMWSAWDKILCHHRRQRTNKDRVSDICTIYLALLELNKDGHGTIREVSVQQESLIRRWAIQLAAVDPNYFDTIATRLVSHSNIQISEDFVQKVLDRARSDWVQFSDNPEADNPEADNPEADNPEADNPEADNPEADNPEADNPDDESLTNRLKRFKCYGGSEEIQNVYSKPFEGEKLAILEEVIAAWDSNDCDQKTDLRMNLAMNFWALSQRLGIPQLLETTN